MVHMRETRASASEIKFVIDPAAAPRLRDWARSHLDPDPHGAGPFGDEYDTSTLYFDTARKDVFQRRNSFGRAKYRIRRYGASDVVFLERKLRRPGLLIKRRTLAPVDALPTLMLPEATGWGGEWFHRRLLARSLRPVCQVSYHRTARTLDTSDGLARFTLDCDLRVVPVGEPRFSTEPPVSFLDDRVIVELKYRVQLPGLFKRLIEDFALEPQSASKYRLGMMALGHVPTAGTSSVQAGADVSYA
jgi:hypothetical protein